jgi:hypothetical protein
MRKPRRRNARSLRRLPPPSSGWWQSLERARLYLAIGAPVVAIIVSAWLYSPDITIQPAAVLNPPNAAGAEFTVSNTGRVTVYNLLFQCEIISENGARFTTSGNIVHLPSGRVIEQSMSSLSPNENITRNCGFGAAIAPPPTAIRYPASIIATAKYTWPLVKWTGSYSRRFSSRQGQGGRIVLVPDPN